MPAAVTGPAVWASDVDDSSEPITPFIYWLVFDIGRTTGDLEEGRLPTGTRQAMNSAGTATIGHGRTPVTADP